MRARREGAPRGRGGWLARARRISAGSSGQAIVEMAVMLPAAIAIAVIVVNALLFFSDCAAFDRAFRNAVRVYATSPAYGQDAAESCALIEQAVAATLDSDRLQAEVGVAGAGASHLTGTLSASPSLFGRGAIGEVFGVSLPRLVHRVDMTVDQYKPGVIV